MNKIQLLMMGALLVAGCGGPHTTTGTPAKLWVATNGDEQHLKLSPVEPNPYLAPAVGAGGSLEAAYTLTGPIEAGTWQIVGDGIIIDSCDVTFAVLWRTTAGDTPVATFTHHFDPAASITDAVLYDGTADGVAVPAAPDDQLVLHITATGGMAGDTSLYGLNGDGAADGGRQPFLTLPPQ